MPGGQFAYAFPGVAVVGGAGGMKSTCVPFPSTDVMRMCPPARWKKDRLTRAFFLFPTASQAFFSKLISARPVWASSAWVVMP